MCSHKGSHITPEKHPSAHWEFLLWWEDPLLCSTTSATFSKVNTKYLCFFKMHLTVILIGSVALCISLSRLIYSFVYLIMRTTGKRNNGEYQSWRLLSLRPLFLKKVALFHFMADHLPLLLGCRRTRIRCLCCLPVDRGWTTRQIPGHTSVSPGLPTLPVAPCGAARDPAGDKGTRRRLIRPTRVPTAIWGWILTHCVGMRLALA